MADVDHAGRTIVALVGQLSANRLGLLDPELLVLGLDGRVVRRIVSHGNALTATVALDAGGRLVVTGDASGIVRVGPLSGAEPHLLLGHAGPVNRVAVSPDGRWIASASGQRDPPLADARPLEAAAAHAAVRRADGEAAVA